MVHIGNDWDDLLQDAIQSESYQHLRQFLIQEYRTHTIYPNMYDIFNAFQYTPYADVKVVILGQDLPQPQSGTRLEFFRAQGCYTAAVPRQHL